MSGEKKAADEIPWYLRIKSLLITAGSLAGAIVAIVGLWNLFAPKEDVADVASFEDVRLGGITTIQEFATEKLGSDLPMQPAQGSADRGLSLELAAVQTPAPEPGPVSTPDPVLDESENPTPAPDIEAPTPGPTESTSPTPTDSLAPTSEATEGEAFALQVISRPGIERFNLKPSDLGVLTSSPLTGVKPVDPGDADGPMAEPLSPDVVAQELEEAFSQVEATDGNGDLEPTGWTVSMNVKLKGLAGVPMILYWELKGTEVPESWSTPNLAYRVLATTDDDQGGADIWVPDLSTPGPYSLNLELRYAADNTLAATGGLEIPD